MSRTITQGDKRSLRRIIRKHIVRSDRDFGMLRTEYIERVEVDDMAADLVEWADRRALRTAPVPAPSVVPEAAVEAAADVVKAHSGPLGDPDEGTLCDCGAVVAPVGKYGVRAWREHVAGAALTAALPFLTAAPSATREEVRDEIAGHPIGSGYYATAVGVDEAAEIADALLARFTITPKEDR